MLHPRFKICRTTFLIIALCLGYLSQGAAQTEAQDNSKKRISLDELLSSQAAIHFQIEEYKNALAEFEKMSVQYPEDPLVKRYVGMTLTLLGRLDEAASALQDAVRMEPSNPANHYFLARVYHEQGNKERASEELDKVVALDPEGFYGRPAKEALILVEQRAIVKRPWDFWMTTGYEYDSNVPLEPNDKELRDLSDKNAGRYFFSAGGSYKIVERPKFDSTVGYRIYQSLHDDSLNEFNYTFQEFHNVNRFRLQWLGREIIAGLRFSMPLGFLNGNIFLWGAEVVSFVNSKITKNTFTEVYHRYSHLEFGPDGEEPNLLSRDGEYNATGIHHRYYFDEYKRYIFVGYEFQNAQVRGNNFDRLGHRAEIGFHAPLTAELSFDVIGSFTVASYPHYSAQLDYREPLSRLDNYWTLLGRLNYVISKNWSMQVYYRYDNAENENDIFQYDRHIGGGQITFRY